MKEISFIKQNAETWQAFEKYLEKKASYDSDYVAELFVRLTDDLSYARTFYPRSNIVKYLNSLTLKAHLLIYKNKRERSNRFKEFWLIDYPLLMHEMRHNILTSAIIFSLAILIGALSAAYDDTFVRLIMGDSYVNMTIDNINKGDPMAVYKQSVESTMFLGITINNIKVAFIAFLFGLFTAFGPGYILFNNGIMLGAFQYFFYQHGLLYESVLSIWIHGTLEIFAIVVAGSAGIAMGNGWVFTGTYTRLVSFQKAARNGVKTILGLIPVFITAGFLEGYVTRHTESPSFIRIGIILLSLAFIIWYFFLYGRRLHQKIITNHS